MEYEDRPIHAYTPILRGFFWLLLSLVQVVPFELLRQAFLHLLAHWEIITVGVARQSDPSLTRFYPKGWEEFFYYIFLLLLGVLVVSFSVMIDYYFRTGVMKHELVKRVLIVAGTEVAVCLVSLAVTLI